MERRSFIRPIAFATALFAVVWLAVILRWRVANRVPTGVDVALYLVALPAGLLFAYMLLRKLIDALRRRPPPTVNAPAIDAAEAAQPANDPALSWHIDVFGVGVLVPAGDDAAAVAAAAAARTRVDLHASLRDSAGLPVFAAEVATVDADAIDFVPDTSPSPSRVRAIALAASLLDRCLDEHGDALRTGATARAHGDSRQVAAAVRVEWLLPARWTDDERSVAARWMTDHLAAAGWDARQLRLDLRPVVDGGDALLRVDELARGLHAKPSATPCLVIASDSHIDEETVAAQESRHALHTATTPEGRVPGEGAAAILIATGSPVDMASLASLASLWRTHGADRQRPVDTPQRLQADTFKALLTTATQHAPDVTAAIDALVSTTDARNSRVAEALCLVEQACPDADANDALRMLGLANGDCGAVTTVACLAVATHLAATAGRVAAVLVHDDPRARHVALVTPPVATPSPCIGMTGSRL